VPLFGAIDSTRPLRVTVHAHGPLEGLTLELTLAYHQVPEAMWGFPDHSRLEVNGLLILSTVLVITLAIGSSRRELLLARTRSDFIAGVSHDLRMPLAQILIAGETLALRRERDETERLALSGSIVREARRLVSLVENVLLFSRSGAVDLRPRLERLPAAIAVLGDRRLVRQALVNLVDNALKYGATGQRIQLVADRPSPDWVRLSVTDEGDGIPRGERERVFEPYARLEHDQTSERTGTGLGLAVVRHIAQVCGGRVWLEDAPVGRGTRVVLELRSASSDPA
jgi:signal transduction histidine kinase